MAMRGPASVLDHRKVNDCDKVVRDRLTRQRSPARSHKRDSYYSEEEEEVVVSSRISQPYRTSFSAVLAPERTKRERSRSMSPCSSLKGSERSRSKSPGGRRGKPKHVTYDTQVVVRESGTHDSIYTQLSDKDLNESSRHFSADSSVLSSDNSTMSDITSSDYSSQLHELSQQIVQEYCNLPKPNGTSIASSHSKDSQTPNGDMKIGDSVPNDNRPQKPAYTLKHDYEHERAISYRVAIKSHYSDEIQKMADKMVEEIPPSKNDVKVNSPSNSETCPQIDRRSSLQIKSDEDSGRLTPSKRSVSKSISNFFRRLSPKLVRKPKGNLSNASSQSEDISDSIDHPNDHEFKRGKIRRSFMKFIGKSPSKSKRKTISGSTPVLTTKEQEDALNRPDVNVNVMGRQMPPATSKYLKSIEQDSKSEKEVYQKFKEKQSPGRKWESNLAANKPNAVQSQGVTSPAPDIASGGPTEVKHLKAEPPASLDIRMVPKSVRALQASVISTLSADESIGECSLDDHLTGSDPSLLTQSTESKKVVLSQSSRDAVSPQSLSPLVTSTPSTFVSTAEYQLTSPSSGGNSSYNGDVKYTPLPKLADSADFPIDDSPRTPSYLRISSALSGYGQYSKYSAYRGIEKRSPYSSTLSLRSSKSDLTSPFSPDMPIGKVPCYAPVLKSPTYSARNGSMSDEQLVNGRGVTHENAFENGHVESYPTGDNRKDGRYYLSVTEVEEARLLSLCSRCDLELVSDSLPEEASGKLRATIGKANLLISQKFRQFKDLCQQHINPEPGAKLTKWEDLQGFWDMMKIQVDDVDMMFTEVDLMRQNGWREVRMQSRRSSTSSSSPKSGSVTASNTSTPSHTPGSRRKGAKVKDNSESSPERTKKAIQAAKAREDARKKLLAEKRAAMKQAQQQKETEVEIFLPENGKDNSNSFANGQNGTEV